MKVAAALLISATTLASAPAAVGAPVDRASVHRAVAAWQQLVRDQVHARHLGRLRLAAYRRSAAARCADGFSVLTAGDPASVNAGVVKNVLDEVGYDAFLVGARPMRPALERFRRRVTKLPWSSPETGSTVRNATRLIELAVSVKPTDICDTARHVTADPNRTPTHTRQLLAKAYRLDIDPLPQLADRLEELALPADRRSLARLARRTDLAYGLTLFRSIVRTTARLQKVLRLDRLQAQLDADSNAKSDARNAVSWLEACYTDTQDYGRCRKPSTFEGLDYGSAPGQVEVTAAGANTWTIVGHSRTGTDFVISKSRAGIISRSCTRPGVLDCPADGNW